MAAINRFVYNLQVQCQYFMFSRHYFMACDGIILIIKCILIKVYDFLEVWTIDLNRLWFCIVMFLLLKELSEKNSYQTGVS